MYYAGIDYHKHYSIVSIQDGQGRIVQEQQVDHAFPELFPGNWGIKGVRYFFWGHWALRRRADR
jgi:hypothetical protein